MGILGLGLIWLSDLPRKTQVTLTAFALCSFAAVAPGYRFYNHYWLFFLPALALMVTSLLYTVSSWLKKAHVTMPVQIMAAGFGGMLLSVSFWDGTRTWITPDYEQIMRSIYPINPFIEDKLVSDYLAKQIKPNEEIAVLGSETPYYVYLNRRPLTRHFYMAFLSRPMELSKTWQQEVLDTLMVKKPEYVVFNYIQYSWMIREGSSQLLYQSSYKWCMEEYDPIGWVFYRQRSKPEIVFGPEASHINPPKDGTPFIMVMQRKK
jgi:hypothetical protein